MSTTVEFNFPGSDTDALEAVAEVPATSCCSSEEQSSCCDASEKSTCCGAQATAEGGCGCQ